MIDAGKNSLLSNILAEIKKKCFLHAWAAVSVTHLHKYWTLVRI